MSYPYLFVEAVAAQRHRELVAAAEQYRLAKRAAQVKADCRAGPAPRPARRGWLAGIRRRLAIAT